MKIINSNTPGLAWKQAYDLVMNNGGEAHDGGILLKEVIDLFVVVKNARGTDKYLADYADDEMIAWMVNENFGGTKPVLDWGYSYGMRFENYGGVNQIEKIVDKLRSNPESKSATISLMDPTTDFDGHMPCIVALDFKIRDNQLNITGFFRSQDIGKKFYADILALSNIQNRVAKLLKSKLGDVKIMISSAHVYENDFNRFAKKRRVQS